MSEQAGKLVKVSCFVSRRPDRTHDEFVQHWTQVHARMLDKPMPDLPKVHRYIQLHPVHGDLNGLASAPYDGVAEIWFGTFDEAVSALTSEHYKAVIAKDEENFLDRSKTVFLFADERVIIDEERDC
jgi:uncharacterized protein (TIGR02118 family)